MSLSYPARFTLVVAMNPCPCGYDGDPTRQCRCEPRLIERYLARVSGPLLDRIDLQLRVPAVDPRDLSGHPAEEPSRSIQARVQEARERQQARFATDSGPFANAHMSAREVRRYCRLSPAGEELLRSAMSRLGLSARAYNRILKVARTIADLAGADSIETPHLGEAIQYRTLDRLRHGARVLG
jgi:magnesium chelatase family protein